MEAWIEGFPGLASFGDGARFVGRVALGGIGGVALMLMGCGGPEPAPGGAENTVRAFLAAEGVEEKMSHLAPDFRLRLWEGEALATRDRYRHMVAWDAVASGEMTLEHTETRGDTVTVRIEERNAFTELLELPPFRVESRFVVADGEILEQRMRDLVGPEHPSFTERFEEALTPVLEWAADAAPELLAAAVDQGRIHYDGDSARALLALIRQYRDRPEGRR